MGRRLCSAAAGEGATCGWAGAPPPSGGGLPRGIGRTHTPKEALTLRAKRQNPNPQWRVDERHRLWQRLSCASRRARYPAVDARVRSGSHPSPSNDQAAARFLARLAVCAEARECGRACIYAV
jgi:hypothetical protein